MIKHPTFNIIEPGAWQKCLQPTIDSAPVRLRPWCASDAEFALFAYQDPAVQRWMKRSLDPSEVVGWIERQQVAWESERFASWIIEFYGTPAGRIVLRNIDLHNAYAEMSFWVSPHMRGQGVSTRSAQALMSWAFEEMGFHKLGITHSTENAVAGRTAQKCGFMHEATLHSAERYDDGWHDMHVWGQTNPAQAPHIFAKAREYGLV